MSARRWRNDPGLDSSKWKVEKKKGWFYATPTNSAPSAPPVGAGTSGGPGVKRPPRPPDEYIGDPTVNGPWQKKPNVSRNDFEFAKGPDGKWFTRPVTELTGLTPTQRGQVGAYDAATGRQAARVTQAYDGLATQAGIDATAGAKALGEFAALAGANVSQTDPTGVALAKLTNQQFTARKTPDVVSLAALPTLARAQGVTSRDQYRAGRDTTRQEVLSGLRGANAEQASANAKVRSDNLRLLGDLAGLDSGYAKALLQEQSSTARNSQDNQTTAYGDQLSSDTSIANTNTNAATSRANAQARAADRSRAGGGVKITLEDRARWTKRARAMALGERRSVRQPAIGSDGLQTVDSNGTPQYVMVDQVGEYSYGEMVRELVSMGAPTPLAKRIARNTGKKPPARRSAPDPDGYPTEIGP